MQEFYCPDDCPFGSSFQEGNTTFFDCLKSKELPADLTFGHDPNFPICPCYEKPGIGQETPEDVINKLLTQSQVIFVFTEKCQVTDKDSKMNAENLLIGAKAAKKKAESTQKEFLEPITEKEKRIRGLFKPYLGKLDECISALTKTLNDYHQKELLLAKIEANQLLINQAAKLAEAKVTGEVVEIQPTVIQAPVKTSHSEMGTTTYRDVIEIQIVNPDLVPRDLCDPSEKKIRARAESGVKEIPGVVISKKSIPVSRGTR
jgi:hypothetical protein